MGVTVTELVVKRSENQEDKGERPSGVPQLFCYLLKYLPEANGMYTCSSLHLQMIRFLKSGTLVPLQNEKLNVFIQER